MHLQTAAEPWQRTARAKQKENFMKLRTIPSTMVAILCLLSAPGLLAAPYLNRTNPLAVQSAKVHRIAFQLRNDSGQTMTVQAGDQALVLGPGKTMSVKLPQGQSLTAAEATSHYPVGEVLAVVDGHLAGNVLVFH